MNNELVIIAVIVIVITAHAWIYMWVKFKIDEGITLKFIKDSESQASFSVLEISSGINLSVNRVSSICKKSNAIAMVSVGEKKLWQLR